MTSRFSTRSTRRQQRGTSTVEFALIAPLLFLLLCFAMDIGISLWVNLTMQYAVREGARYAVTGQSNLDTSTTNPSQQQRYLAIIEEIKRSSMGLYNMVDPSFTITINNQTQSYSTRSEERRVGKEC